MVPFTGDRGRLSPFVGLCKNGQILPCKQNFSNQFWIQGTLCIVHSPLAQKGNPWEFNFTEIVTAFVRILMSDLLHLKRMTFCIFFYPMLLNWKCLKTFLTFLYHIDVNNLCLVIFENFCLAPSTALRYNHTLKLTFIKPPYCWIEIEQ